MHELNTMTDTTNCITMIIMHMLFLHIINWTKDKTDHDPSVDQPKLYYHFLAIAVTSNKSVHSLLTGRFCYHYSSGIESQNESGDLWWQKL